jgi:hypothetical protein
MMGGEDKARGEHYFLGEDCITSYVLRIMWWFLVEDLVVVFPRSLFEIRHKGYRGCWGFWARGARKPQGFLELGS